MNIIKMMEIDRPDRIKQTIPVCTSSEPLWISAVHEVVESWRVTPDRLHALESALVDLGYNLANVTLVVNETAHIPSRLVQINVVYINFFRLQVYYYKYFTEQEFNTQWKSCDQVLFLMGKSYKPHRVPLLKALLDRIPRDQLVYSFNSGQGTEVYDKTHEVFQDHFPDLDYADFAEQYHHQLIDTTTLDGVNFHYSGFPFGVRVYENTALSVISETHWEHHNDLPDCFTTAWNTEKIWRAIANHHPFVMISCEYLPVLLQSQGYLLWEQFLIHDPVEINQIADCATRINMVVDNVESFLKRQTSEISAMAKHNADLMDMHARQDIDQVFHGDQELFCKFMEVVRVPNL